jgi:hypothetical protein
LIDADIKIGHELVVCTYYERTLNTYVIYQI